MTLSSNPTAGGDGHGQSTASAGGTTPLLNLVFAVRQAQMGDQVQRTYANIHVLIKLLRVRNPELPL